MPAQAANGKPRRSRDHAADHGGKAAASAVTPWPGREEQPKPRPMSQPPRERGGRGMRQPAEESVVGLGDLVPAFLMTPVRRAK